MVVSLLSVALCACEPDRGKCLRSRIEHKHEDEWTELLLLPDGNGGLYTMPMPHPAEDRDVTVCERWQYPNGPR